MACKERVYAIRLKISGRFDQPEHPVVLVGFGKWGDRKRFYSFRDAHLQASPVWTCFFVTQNRNEGLGKLLGTVGGQPRSSLRTFKTLKGVDNPSSSYSVETIAIVCLRNRVEMAKAMLKASRTSVR